METLHAQPDIAVVDDDTPLCEAIEALLRSAGFRAKSFATAEDFLRSPCVWSAGCLILDIGLAETGMNGLVLQRHLAGNGHRIPIVFITAQTDGDMEEQALRNGAAAFLHKPFGDEDLLTAVRRAVEH